MAPRSWVSRCRDLAEFLWPARRSAADGRDFRPDAMRISMAEGTVLIFGSSARKIVSDDLPLPPAGGGYEHSLYELYFGYRAPAGRRLHFAIDADSQDYFPSQGRLFADRCDL